MQTKYRSRLIVTVGILIFSLMVNGCGKSEKPPQGGTPEVATVTISTQQVVLTTELPGRTSAYLLAEVRPQVSGIIQKRLFTEGVDVKAGEVLYQIDPAPYQAVLDNAKGALGRAEANLPAIRLKFERYRDLLADKAVSQQEYDDTTAALKQAEADVQYSKATVESARINLRYTRVTTPISGRIGKSNVTVGATVTAYQPLALATIQQLDPMYVDVPQSTTELQRLKRSLEDGHLNQNGAKQKNVKLILEDGTPYPLEGTLQFRDVTVEPTTGSVILRVVVPNPKGMLLPGMFVRALVKEGINEQTILVPQQAVSRDPKGNPYVLIVDGSGKVEQRTITVARAIGDKWNVSSGLAPGDQVIVEGMQRVRPGAPVKVVPFDAGQKDSPQAGKTVNPPAKTVQPAANAK
jgi:membrane fusion protein (multidrug efflux system)